MIFRFMVNLADDIRGTKNPDKKYIAKMVQHIKEMHKEGLFDEAQTREIIDRLQPHVYFSSGWKLTLSYPLSVENNTDQHRAENREIYRKRIIQGLDLFGIGEKFAECFKS